MSGREQVGSKIKHSKGIQSGGVLLQIEWWKNSVKRWCLIKGLNETKSSSQETWEYNMVFSTRGKYSWAAIFLLGKEKLTNIPHFVFHKLVLPPPSSLTKYFYYSNEHWVHNVMGVDTICSWPLEEELRKKSSRWKGKLKILGRDNALGIYH